LNDSFAHIKRELAATQYRNEMMDFMWTTFRKLAGVQNRETSENDDDEEAKKKSMNEENGVPLAEFDADVL
jgi:hypothetical protein